MNEKVKKEVFEVLNRLTEVINNNPLIKKLSDLVEIETGVVGGAVRDLYLDKPIKDIDVAIGLNFNKNLKVNYPKRYIWDDSEDDVIVEQSAEAKALELRSKQVLRLLGQEEFSFMHDYLLRKEKPPSAIQAVVFLIKKIFEQEKGYSIVKVYDQENIDMQIRDVNLREKAYEDIGLCAVIAISDKNTNYPIELLFTPDGVSEFIDCFDFNLCKIFMQNKDGNAEIVPSCNFLKDCENMTITYKPYDNITEEKMNKSLFVRYERFQNKMPEYTLIADTSLVLSKDTKDMVEKTVKGVSLYHQIKNSSENKVENTIKQKPKKI